MKVNTEKKEEANFFFEKVLQRFNPRTLIKKPKRGENPSDPTYYLIDYLARKKKVTVEDLWEMKNPSARLAKAAITIRTSSKAAKDSQKVQYETIEQVEDFMKDTGMWSKEEIKKLGEHDEDNSEDENLGEVEKQIREIILTKIQNSQKYHKSFEALMREALASNLRKVQSRTNIPFLMKNFPGTRERTSSWNKTGRLYDSHAPLVKEYIKNTPSSERRQFDDTLFIKYFLEVFEDPSELLGLEPGTCYLKDLRQVLIDLYGEKKVPLNLFTDGLNGTGNLALEAMMTATQEASQQKTQGLGVEADISEPSTPELILRSNSPSNLKVLMSGLNKYKREAIRNIVQEEKLDYAETQRIKKVIYQTKKTQLTNQEGIENSSKSSKKSLEKSKDQSIVSSKSKRQGIARFNSKIYNGDSEKKSRADRIRRNNILNTIDNKIDLMSNNDPEMLRNVKGSFKRQLEAQR